MLELLLALLDDALELDALLAEDSLSVALLDDPDALDELDELDPLLDDPDALDALLELEDDSADVVTYIRIVFPAPSVMFTRSTVRPALRSHALN